MHLIIVHKNTSNVGRASLADWTMADDEKQSFLFANFHSLAYHSMLDYQH